MNYLFDVDGTLTPNAKSINKKFKTFFLNWMKDKKVYLVSGGDVGKTKKQLGKDIWRNSVRTYHSCGNAVYEKGKLIRQDEFELNEEQIKLISVFNNVSQWPYKFNSNSNTCTQCCPSLIDRIGLVIFSTMEGYCPKEKREEYYNWDKEHQERKLFCEMIEDKYPHLEAKVRDDVRIAIYPKGKDKSQILNDFKGPITFFGDRCEPNGVDYSIVSKIKDKHTVHCIKDWKETWDILKEIR